MADFAQAGYDHLKTVDFYIGKKAQQKATIHKYTGIVALGGGNVYLAL
ncbi:MAG: hypothetical protein HRT36_08775 [Alphaproteobacteria bacterium]|nr:hypothetical protein [Alphaproteobacteria bacterium]